MKTRPTGARKGHAEGAGRCVSPGGCMRPGRRVCADARLELAVGASLHLSVLAVGVKVPTQHAHARDGHADDQEHHVGHRVQAEDDGEDDEQQPGRRHERPQGRTRQVRVRRLASGRQWPRHAAPVAGRVALPGPGQAGDADQHEQAEEQRDEVDEVVPDRDDDLGDQVEDAGPELSEVHGGRPLGLCCQGHPSRSARGRARRAG